MNSTENKTVPTAADFDFVLDTTVEAPLNDLQKFENFQRRLQADREAVKAELARREEKKADLRRFSRLLGAL